MNTIEQPMIRKAMSIPCLRQNILNQGTLFLYCDYAGFASSNAYGAACCMVYNRTVTVASKKLPMNRDQGSIYGEMMAIVLSLETLAAAALERQPKIAVIYTDCSRIARLLVQDQFAQRHDEEVRDALLKALAALHRQFPNLDVQIKYMRTHKRNNYLHQLAHHAAREAALTGR